MDATPMVDLLKAWSSLIAAISWPLVVVFVLLFFGRPLRAFLQNLGDDRPNNNVYERMALEALGIRFVISASTEDAVGKLRAGNYDLVISDMGRPQSARSVQASCGDLGAAGREVIPPAWFKRVMGFERVTFLECIDCISWS